MEQVDFEGFWIASYGNHGLELVEIRVNEGKLVARKVTGDPHVPGGEVSFEVDLRQGGRGRIQIAEKNFRNPEWAPGCISAPYDYNSFIFEWADVRRKFTRVNVTSGLDANYSESSNMVFKNDPSPLHSATALKR